MSVVVAVAVVVVVVVVVGMTTHFETKETWYSGVERIGNYKAN